MFQSRRIASGSCRLHVSMASSPFSASTIWNSSPSRIRRATLRMTLESSTTKQVFITSSLHASRANPLGFHRCPTYASRHRQPSCRRGFDAEVEHAIDVEHDKELAVEPKNAGGDAAQMAMEIDRIGLALA